MKPKYGMMILAAALVVVGSYADPVQVSVTGTAISTAMGYTSGQSYTFNWILSDGYTGGSADNFPSYANLWHSAITADPLLWTSFSGDGLSGTYTRATGTSTAPYDYISADSGGLYLHAGNQDPSGSSIGLTVDGTEVLTVYAYSLGIPGLDYSDTAFVNPASWLAGYTNTYTLSSGGIRVRDETYTDIFFTPTSATIQAIPEPSTIAFVGIFGSGIFIVRRYFPNV